LSAAAAAAAAGACGGAACGGHDAARTLGMSVKVATGDNCRAPRNFCRRLNGIHFRHMAGRSFSEQDLDLAVCTLDDALAFLRHYDSMLPWAWYLRLKLELDDQARASLGVDARTIENEQILSLYPDVKDVCINALRVAADRPAAGGFAVHYMAKPPAADGVFRVSLETPAHALLACTVLFAESRLVVHISGSIFD
jgi:hypothetical protein